MSNRIQNELNTILPRPDAEEKMYNAILEKAQNKELTKELHADEKKFNWKVLVPIAACLAVVLGIFAAVRIINNKLPVAENPITASDAVMITIDPDGNEYRSTDNGESWTVNGEETDEKPAVFFTVESILPYSFNNDNPIVRLHNDLEEEMLVGLIKEIEIYQNGKWISPEYTVDAFTLMAYGVPSKGYLEQRIPLNCIVPTAGRYRCYMSESKTGYTCIVEFSAVTEKYNSVLTVNSPDGTEYVSYDNGISWLKNGKKFSGTPYAYITLPTVQALPSDRDTLVTIHNAYTLGELSLSSCTIEAYKNGEWTTTDYTDPEMGKYIGIVTQEAYPAANGHALSMYIPTSAFASTEPMYRLTMSLSDKNSELYTCTAEFYIADYETLPSDGTHTIVTTSPEGVEYRSTDNGQSWTENGEPFAGKPPIFFTTNATNITHYNYNSVFVLHNMSDTTFKLQEPSIYIKLNDRWSISDLVEGLDYDVSPFPGEIIGRSNGLYSALRIYPLAYIYGETTNYERNIAGDYKYTVTTEDGYNCSVIFNVEDDPEQDAESERAPTISVTAGISYPFNTEYISYDSGASWTMGGTEKLSSKPKYYATTSIEGEVNFDSKPLVTIFNNSDTDLKIVNARLWIYNNYDYIFKTPESVTGDTSEFAKTFEDEYIKAGEKKSYFIPLTECAGRGGTYHYVITSAEGYSFDVQFYARKSEDYDEFRYIDTLKLNTIAEMNSDITDRLMERTPVDITTLSYYEEAKKIFDEYPEDYEHYSYINMYQEYIGTEKADFIAFVSWTLNGLYPAPPAYYSELVYIKDNAITDTLFTAEGDIELIQKEGNDVFFSVYTEDDSGGLYRFDLETEEFEKLVSGSGIQFKEANSDYIHYQQETVRVYVRSTGEIITVDYSDSYYYTDAMLGSSTLYYPNDGTKSYNALDLITGEISPVGDRDSVLEECKKQNEKDKTYTVEMIEDVYNPRDNEGFMVKNNNTNKEGEYYLGESDFDYIGIMDGKLYFIIYDEGLLQFDPVTEEATILSYDTKKLNLYQLDTEKNVILFIEHGIYPETSSALYVCEIA